MSSTASPFGLRPVYKAGGTPASLTMTSTITSGYGTAIFANAPVKLGGGILVAAVGTTAGDATGGIVGTFMGVEYTDANGRRQESNQWIAGLTGTNIIAYYTADPYLTYEVQANGSIAQSNVGAQIDFVAAAGNTTTGLSTTAVDTATISTGAQRLLRIVGLTPGPDNAFGDAFTIVQVQIAKHQFVTPVIGIA